MDEYRFGIGDSIIFILRVLRDLEANKDPMPKMWCFF
jgi:hypothetical protein